MEQYSVVGAPCAHYVTPKPELRPHYPAIPTRADIGHATQSASQEAGFITIRHPGYPTNNRLLLLPATDFHDSIGSGLHALIVRTACAVVTNNSEDGWLSKDAAGKEPLQYDDDGIIPIGDYYYHMPQLAASAHAPSAPYPIVPTFSDWSFPHNKLPESWARLRTPLSLTSVLTTSSNVDSTPTRPRDQSLAPRRCCLTNHSLVVEKAHIIPRADVERRWFLQNEMDRYCIEETARAGDPIDSPHNIVPLRSDIHKLWDGSSFAVVPKCSNNNVALLVAHSMVANPEILDLYHNTPLSLGGKPVELFYARLAWSIFPLLRTFLNCSAHRWFVTRAEDGSLKTDLGQSDLWKLSQRPRTPSPRKRRSPSKHSSEPRSTECMAGDDLECVDEWKSGIETWADGYSDMPLLRQKRDCSASSWSDSGYHPESVQEHVEKDGSWNGRGRKRRRTGSFGPGTECISGDAW